MYFRDIVIMVPYRSRCEEGNIFCAVFTLTFSSILKEKKGETQIYVCCFYLKTQHDRIRVMMCIITGYIMTWFRVFLFLNSLCLLFLFSDILRCTLGTVNTLNAFLYFSDVSLISKLSRISYQTERE